MVEIVEKIL